MDAVAEKVPESVPDTSAGVSYKDAGSDFDHPAGEVPAKSFRGGDEDDDGHQSTCCDSSISGPLTPMYASSSKSSA
ncbi:hypothetical protein Asi03nite_19570 [Actinoplanes siamensis]|uniref:Uncharacterized protein n=1 Tax=Actinoplanes siamensis TaxID=1223317 RepID=A0A919TJF7_9ACTN|nr:hypothetical protein Asi03nite_19570 [Actinoplanes siamensis]